MKVSKIHDSLPLKSVDFELKKNFGNITNLMIFGQKVWTVDSENDQKWSIGSFSQKLRIFQI